MNNIEIRNIPELKKYPNVGFIWNIIEQNQNGRIFEPDKNCFLILQNGPLPFGYMVGKITENAIDQIIRLVENLDFPKIFCAPKFHEFFLRRGWSCHLRAELKLDPTLGRKSLEKTPQNIKKIESLIDYRRSLLFNKLLILYEYNEGLIYKTPLYVMQDGEGNLSEVIVLKGLGHGEIGIATNPDYPGKG